MSNHSGFAGVCCHRCVGGKCVYLFWDLGKAGEIPLFLVQIPLLILLGMHSDCALGSIPGNTQHWPRARPSSLVPRPESGVRTVRSGDDSSLNTRKGRRFLKLEVSCDEVSCTCVQLNLNALAFRKRDTETRKYTAGSRKSK